MKSLYIHIPFCEKKCNYCDFCSFQSTEEQRETYVNTLIKEIDKIATSEPLKSIFIGGGTPSLLKAPQIGRIIDKVRKVFYIDEKCEITIECNPNSLSEEKIKIYQECGVNRLSIGVQTLNDDILKTIGRVHTSQDFYKIAEVIAKYFNNYNFDLMVGLPNQTLTDVENTINNCLKFMPTHISLYSLILESKVPLERSVKSGEIILPNEDDVVEQYTLGAEMVERAGLARYEISNFAKSGCESIHNLHYWACGEYYGVGLSSHSYVDGKRFSNTTSLSEYLKAEFTPQNIEILSRNEQIEERIMLALRMTKGLNLTELKAQLNYDLLYEKADKIKNMFAHKLIEIDGDYLRISPNQFYISNAIIEELI